MHNSITKNGVGGGSMPQTQGHTNHNAKSFSRHRISEFKNSIDRAFNNFFNIMDCPITPISDFNLIEPKIEVNDGAKDINVTVEMPGMSEDDIAVDVSEEGFLTIRGEKRKSNEKHTDGAYFSELSYGMVSRTVALPAEVDVSKVSADFENGVLRINLPKTKEELSKVRRVKIKAKK